MGSFNIKCNFTDLAIQYGDEVVAFPIYKMTGYRPVDIYFKDKDKLEKGISSSNSRCYTDSFWHPILCPIFGKYDDYGSTELIETDPYNLDRVIDYFTTILDSCYSVLPGENQYHDYPFDKEEFTKLVKEKGLNAGWQYLQSLMYEGRLFYRHYTGQPVEMGLMVISKLAYDIIISNKSYDGKELFEWNAKTVDEMFDEGVKEINDELDKFPEDRRIALFMMSEKPYAWRITNNYSSKEIFNDMKIRLKFTEKMLADPESMRGYITPFIAAAKVITTMNWLNKLVLPLMTAGQDTSWEDELYKLTNSIRLARKHKRRKDCDHNWIPFSKEDLEHHGGTFPICMYCDETLDKWYCPAPKNYERVCEYDEKNDPACDSCIHCGLPQERK